MFNLISKSDMIKGQRKITYAGSSFQISIPKWWCKHHKLKVGDILDIGLQTENCTLIMEARKNESNETKTEIEESNSEKIA